ncbi:hypothetical protein TWF506_005319 [Arthrobotrys conoides]|uniref:Uncharacterized protein n=1 Tax=Arthrobotrys conoides TaxID=74498 RepID=A0AAN8RZY0_9PEZI
MRVSVLLLPVLAASWASAAALPRQRISHSMVPASAINIAAGHGKFPVNKAPQDPSTSTDTDSTTSTDSDVVTSTSTDTDLSTSTITIDTDTDDVSTDTPTNSVTTTTSMDFTTSTNTDVSSASSIATSNTPSPDLISSALSSVTPIITKITEIVPAATTTVTKTPPGGIAKIIISTVRASFTTVRTYVIEAHGHTTITRVYTVPYPSPSVVRSTSVTYSPVTIETTYTTVVTVTRALSTTFRSWDISRYTTRRPITKVAVGEVTGIVTVHPVTYIVITTYTTTEEVFPSYATTTLAENGTPVISTIHIHHHSDDLGIHSDWASHDSALEIPTTQGGLVSTPSGTPELSLPTISHPTLSVPSIPVPSISVPSVSLPTQSFDLNALTPSLSTSTWITTELVTLSDAVTAVVGIPTHIPAVSLFTSIQSLVTTLQNIVTVTGIPKTFDISTTSLITVPTTISLPTPSIPLISTPSLSLPSASAPSISSPSISLPSVPTISVPSVTLPTLSVPSITLPTVTVPTATAKPTVPLFYPVVNKNPTTKGPSPHQMLEDQGFQLVEETYPSKLYTRKTTFKADETYGEMPNQGVKGGRDDEFQVRGRR